MNESWESFTQTCSTLGIKPTDRVLWVRIGAQTMQFYRQTQLVKSYPISTSAKAPSNVSGSLGTPCGLHEIAERIGGEQPAGMVFKGRRPTGQHFSEHADDGNLITSRILWLRGLDPGVNSGLSPAGVPVDTYERYVYLHGTNREDRLGHPQSAGCVLMANLDIIGLYEEVRAGDQVWITP
ncbi:MAG: L,D-transpeptidase [Verrucomicrobia bacterium]|nr:MAG: L,D-transpeptidase [Verrucomicrobiota bacterium]